MDADLTNLLKLKEIWVGQIINDFISDLVTNLKLACKINLYWLTEI